MCPPPFAAREPLFGVSGGIRWRFLDGCLRIAVIVLHMYSFWYALVPLLVWTRSYRGRFRVPFAVGWCFRSLMHDPPLPPVYGAVLCVVLVCVFRGFAWVFDWNRIVEEGLSGSVC